MSKAFGSDIAEAGFAKGNLPTTTWSHRFAPGWLL